MRRRPWLSLAWRYRVALWVGAFLLYAATTAGDILASDNGEFQLAAAGWGILHPPGYPLYTVVSALWVRLLPLGALPWRLNLLSALLAATTLLLVAEVVRAWGEGWGLSARAGALGGAGAALLLASAPTFWAQATTANIRMPTLLFAAWGFLALAHYGGGDAAGRERALLSLALAVGLGVGHHPSLVFVALGWLLYLVLVDPALAVQPRRWWKPALVVALAWALPQLYIPLRGGMANVPLAGEGLNTWEGFWYHVLAQGFSGDMFAFATQADLVLRAPLLGTLFRLQFPSLFLLAALGGWLVLFRGHWRLALALGLSWGVHTFVTITYRAPQTVEYLMPAYLPVVLAWGLGLALLTEIAASRRRLRLLPYALALLLLLRPFGYLSDFLILARDRSVRERVAPLLAEAPSGALILADWRWAMPLQLLQAVEGQGPGVEVIYVHPVAGQEYEAVWRGRAEAAGDRPLFTTHGYDWPGWTFAPVGGGYRLYRQPLLETPALPGFQPLEAELGPVRVLAYRIEGEPRPGGLLEVQLAWEAMGPQEPAPSFTVRLFGSDALFLAQRDRFLGSDAIVGEVRFETFTLRLPLNTCPDAVYPQVGLYTVVEGAFENLGEAALPALPVTCDRPALPAVRFHPGLVPGGPFLKGVDYDVRSEMEALAYLHWCGPGRALAVQSEGVTAYVEGLLPGECRTVQVPVAVGVSPRLILSRPEGERVTLWAPPLPAPRLGEVYIPFADELLLVGAERAQRGEYELVELKWRALRPLVDDYAVSIRLMDGEGVLLGSHDMQPALGAIPTLKWVVRGAEVLDPHPFAVPEPASAWAEIVVYERFRITPLPSDRGEDARVRLP